MVEELDADLLRIPRLLLESWNQRDAQAFAGLFTPTAEYVTGAGERITGREAIAQLLETSTPAVQVRVVGQPTVERDARLGQLSFRWSTSEAAGVARHGRITCRCSRHESGWLIESLHNDEAGSVAETRGHPSRG